MNQLKPPQAFEPATTPATAWTRWRERYENYALASGVVKKTVEEQRAILLHVIGENGYEVYQNLTLTATGDLLTVKVILDAIDEYYRPYKNEVFLSYEFASSKQLEGQSIDDFVTELKRKSKDCGYGNMTDRMIRDRLIAGIKDKELRQKILEKKTLTLTETIDMCRAAEISKDQNEVMQVENVLPSGGINQVRQKSFFKQNTSNKNRDFRKEYSSPEQGQGSKVRDCLNCGLQHPPRQCPAYNQTCNYCHNVGHFAKCCRKKTRKIQFLQQPEYQQETEKDFVSFDSIKLDQLDKSKSSWMVKLQIHGIGIDFKIDTGAEANAIPSHILTQFGIRLDIKPTEDALITYNNGRLCIKGYTEVQCTTERGICYNLPFYIVENGTQPILGLETCIQLSLIKRLYTMNQINSRLEDLKEEFKHIFRPGVGKLPQQFHIQLSENVKPHISMPRKIPKALETQVRAELDWLLENHIIRKTEEPTEWVNPIVIVPKSDGKSVRICMDPQFLNKYIVRAVHHLPTLGEILSRIQGAQIFSKSDSPRAFYHMELDEPSQKLCTFATPYGRFSFLRVPFGIKCAPEMFQKAMEDIYGHIPNVQPFEDDLLMWGKNEEEHFTTVRMAFQAASDNNLLLNPEKTILNQEQIKYLGNIISGEGIKPDPTKLTAISDLPPPTSKKQLQQFLGMINHLSRFIPNHSELTYLLRQLLKKETAWHWDANLQQAFEKLKTTLITAPVLAIFDSQKDVILQTDASSYGMGVALMQEGRPIAYASASLTTAQQAYAQIEKELLAILYGCQHFHYYTYGREIRIQTDHKPLLGLKQKSYDQISPRLQRMLLRLLHYDTQFEYVPGKNIELADALSRSPTQHTYTEMNQTLELSVITSLVPTFSDGKLAEFQQQTAADSTLQELIRYIQEGWPTNDHQASPEVKKYKFCIHELYTLDGLVCRGSRIVIPTEARPYTIRLLHETHRGSRDTKSRARGSLYWPGMTADIEVAFDKCEQCHRHMRSNQSEPLQPREIPSYPWQQVGTDIFYYNQQTFFIMVDYFSNYVIVHQMQSTTANQVNMVMNNVIAHHGPPSILVSDNGPPYSSRELQMFLKVWDIQWRPSSPKHPQSNGLVERTIQTLKTQMKKMQYGSENLPNLVLGYNTTPNQTGRTPAEQYFGRKIRSRLPALPISLRPKYPTASFKERQQVKEKQKHYADAHTRSLLPLQNGQLVWYQLNPEKSKEWKKAIVLRKSVFPRAYVVQTEEGLVLRRNRRHLRLRVSQETTPTSCTSATSVKRNDDSSSVISDDLSLCGEEREQRGSQMRTRSGRITRPPTYLKDYVLNSVDEKKRVRERASATSSCCLR